MIWESKKFWLRVLRKMVKLQPRFGRCFRNGKGSRWGRYSCEQEVSSPKFLTKYTLKIETPSRTIHLCTTTAPSSLIIDIGEIQSGYLFQMASNCLRETTIGSASAATTAQVPLTFTRWKLPVLKCSKSRVLTTTVNTASTDIGKRRRSTTSTPSRSGLERSQLMAWRSRSGLPALSLLFSLLLRWSWLASCGEEVRCLKTQEVERRPDKL